MTKKISKIDPELRIEELKIQLKGTQKKLSSLRFYCETLVPNASIPSQIRFVAATIAQYPELWAQLARTLNFDLPFPQDLLLQADGMEVGEIPIPSKQSRLLITITFPRNPDQILLAWDKMIDLLMPPDAEVNNDLSGLTLLCRGGSVEFMRATATEINVAAVPVMSNGGESIRRHEIYFRGTEAEYGILFKTLDQKKVTFEGGEWRFVITITN